MARVVGGDVRGRGVARWALIVAAFSLLLSLVTCLLVVLYMIHHNAELAKRDAAISVAVVRAQTAQEQAEKMRDDLSALQKWTIAVYERAEAIGWKLPPLPKQEAPRAQEKTVQPARRGSGPRR